MAKAKSLPEAKSPLIIRFHRFMDAFSKSDDERDFYLDRLEGFLVYVDLDKSEEELEAFDKEVKSQGERFVMLPKMTFFETKKFMEGFVQEKVYDIDVKEKLLDIIAGKEARENFLEFIYDHVTEIERWQQYYHERSRIRIIEWLRTIELNFVFEEDLELPKNVVQGLKEQLFQDKVSKELQSARQTITTKSKIYYSNEALNPRPKRGRPPKQQQKVELEPQLSEDLYTQVPSVMRPFLFMPDFSSSTVTFSAKFDTEAQFLASLKGTTTKVDTRLEALSQRLESLRHLSAKIKGVPELGEEDKVIQAIASDEGGDDALSGIAKGLFPKKRNAPPKEAKEIGKYLAQKRQTKIKKVSQITKKKK